MLQIKQNVFHRSINFSSLMDTGRTHNLQLETLEGFDIVCLTTAKWMAIHGVCQNTMSLLAKKNRVLVDLRLR